MAKRKRGDMGKPRRFGLYILRDREPVPVEDLMEWAQWRGDNEAESIVKQETFGDVEVSTVFLGVDHSLGRIMGDPNAPPLLFETAIFRGFRRAGGVEICGRCSTWAQAEAQHEEVARRLRAAVSC